MTDSWSAPDVLLTALLSGTVIATVINLIFTKRSTRAVEKIRQDLAEQLAISQSQRAWKERSMSDLLGPIRLQFDRTRRAFLRYEERDVYLEAKVLREGNLAIRDRLLAYGHLIPRELIDDAGRLVEHYDRWLEEFEDQRGAAVDLKLSSKFVFVGPKGAPFPRDAEEHFLEHFDGLWKSLYDS